MKKDTEQVLKWILEDEGGYTEEHGLGGATNYGITHTFFAEVRAKQEKPVPTIQDLRNLTAAEAADIYEMYVLPLVHFNDLPVGLDYVMVNTAIMDGLTGAKKMMQEALGAKVDGDWGPETWWAIKNKDPCYIAAKLILVQLKHKMSDSRVRRYGKSWANRSIRVWDRTMKLMNCINK